MSDDLKIAVLDSDKVSANNWKVLLRFIGETPILVNIENWRSVLDESDKNRIGAIIFGGLQNSSFDTNTATSLLQELHNYNPDLPIVYFAESIAIDDLPSGLTEKLYKLQGEEIQYQNLDEVLKKVRDKHGHDKAPLQSKLISETGTAMFRSLVGESELMQQTRDQMKQVADKEVNVLIRGESGTGKEILARNIHYHSGRTTDPFVVVSCGTLSDNHNLVELVGEESPSGRDAPLRVGLFEKAMRGTIFLDEIADLSLPLQAKLLAILEKQAFERLGGSESLPLNARLIAATHQDLESKIIEGKFREDLYYYLNVVPIEMPSLRDRKQDIPDLISELIVRFEHQESTSIRFNSSAIVSLQRHPWKGNVRELANLVERLSIIKPNDMIGLHDLPVNYQHMDNEEAERIENPQESAELDENNDSSTPEDAAGMEDLTMSALQPLTEENFKHYLSNFEKNLLQVAIEDSDGQDDFAAERLSLSLEELANKKKVYDL